MIQDNINNIITNTLLVNKDNLDKNVRDIVMQIKKAFDNNKDNIVKTSLIDKKNNNGFVIDFKVIDNIFSNVLKDNIYFGDVTLSMKDDNKKIIYGMQIMDYGNVLVINDGNPYVIVEMILRNIMAGNTLIFSNNGYMYGVNQLLIQIVQSVLEKFNISKYMVQMYICEEFDEILSNYANIDLVLCIGNRNLQNLILEKSKIRTLTSGYECFDLYIEDKSHVEFLDKIIDIGLDIQVYIKDSLDLDYPGAIIVMDNDEAIAQINYNGSRYSSAIFTSSSENASKFIRQVKSTYITVNTSPTIERIIDIKQTDLVREKKIIYPLSFNFDGKMEEIDLNS